MGAVAYLDWRNVKSSKVLRQLSKHYYAGRFDESASSYNLDKLDDSRIILSISSLGSYSNPDDDDTLSEVNNNKFTGTMSLWGRTSGRGYSTDDPDPWKYSYVDLCFINNELIAVVSDDKLIWSPYRLSKVIELLNAHRYKFQYEIDLNKLSLATKVELNNLPFRTKAVPTDFANAPSFTYTQTETKAVTDLHNAWKDCLIGGKDERSNN